MRGGQPLRRYSSASTVAIQRSRSGFDMPSHATMIATRYPGTSPNWPRIWRLMVFSGFPVRRARSRCVSSAAFARICHGVPSIAGAVARTGSAMQAFNAT